jgi:D-ribose pyranase
MLNTGIPNPPSMRYWAEYATLAPWRTSDRGFPVWPQIETIDSTLIDDIPTVLNVRRQRMDGIRISQPSVF